MGYHAIAMGREEFTFGTEFLKDQIGASKIPFLSANAYVGETKEPLGRPYVIRELGRVKVAILGLTAPPVKKSPVSHGGHEPVQAGESAFEVADPLTKARENLAILKDKVDLVIVVSDLPEKENTALAAECGAVDVILATRGKVPAENVSGGGTVIVTPRSGHLARLDIYVSSEGRPLRHEINWIHLSEDIASDPEIKQFISRSLAELAKNKGVQPAGRQKVSDQSLGQEGDNGYTGAESCLGCHGKEYASWRMTRHARAFETLTRARSQVYPDCFSCHTTGFRARPPIGRLRGVQCEVCHGPGVQHTINPATSRLRGTVPVSVCLECHNKDITPTLEQQKDLFYGRIRHDFK
ncbi:MAG: hypothetical protein D4R73_11010 [Deltaproteobacteria bacterium]|nr:MAG: hypothetical protein D4R73_11010 [Deltaproteobacteria bacterium]